MHCGRIAELHLDEDSNAFWQVNVEAFYGPIWHLDFPSGSAQVVPEKEASSTRGWVRL